jgi:hypothetical protein
MKFITKIFYFPIMIMAIPIDYIIWNSFEDYRNFKQICKEHWKLWRNL